MFCKLWIACFTLMLKKSAWQKQINKDIKKIKNYPFLSSFWTRLICFVTGGQLVVLFYVKSTLKGLKGTF